MCKAVRSEDANTRDDEGLRIAFSMRVGDTNFLWLYYFNLEHWRWNMEGSIILGKLEAFEPAEPTCGKSQNESVFKWCQEDIM